MCHLCGDDDAGLHVDESGESETIESKRLHMGRLLPMQDGYWVHASCALWSSEVFETPNDGMLHAVEKARGRGAQLKCFGCGRSGATVGCCKSNCAFNYHLPCVKACGATFTEGQQVFCANHKPSADGVLRQESFEIMKALFVAPEKKTEKDSTENIELDLCSRVGALVVHSLGEIEQNCDGFHSENYITPPGYMATRIFWSTIRPRTRTVYILRIERSSRNRARFSILPADNPSSKITGHSVSQVYSTLVDLVRKANAEYFSGDLYSKLPVIRKTRRKTYGLNGQQVR